MSRQKRVFEETFEDNNESQRALNYPPSKKRKISPNIIEIESIFKIIDQSSLTQHLNIPPIINKKIAEYARGHVKYCSNTRCKQLICVFNDDDTNTIDIRYKSCVSGLQIFCIDCMEFAVPAVEMSTHSDDSLGCWNSWHRNDICCHQLQFIPDCSKCDSCHQPLPKQCACVPFDLYAQCYNCDSTTCNKCYDYTDPNSTTSCHSCRQLICCGCRAGREDDIFGRYVCVNCYDDTVIECGECSLSYPLLYKTNRALFGKNNSKECATNIMRKCKEKDCDTFVCLECNPEQSDHIYCISDERGRCTEASGTFCDEHVPPKCWRIREFEEQSEINYEGALQMLLNEGRCVDVYDFPRKRWRPVKYFSHWNHTRKIMISYTDDCHHDMMDST
eukprot:834476_1